MTNPFLFVMKITDIVCFLFLFLTGTVLLPLVRRKAEFHSFMPSFCQFKVFILLQRTAFTILEQNPSHVNTLL